MFGGYERTGCFSKRPVCFFAIGRRGGRPGLFDPVGRGLRSYSRPGTIVLMDRRRSAECVGTSLFPEPSDGSGVRVFGDASQYERRSDVGRGKRGNRSFGRGGAIYGSEAFGWRVLSPSNPPIAGRVANPDCGRLRMECGQDFSAECGRPALSYPGIGNNMRAENSVE